MTASKEVLDALRASGLALEAQACLAAIAEGEVGSWGAFRTLFGDTKAHPASWTGSMDKFPDWPGKTTSRGITHAAGAWQDQPGTYAGFASISTSFEPAAQIEVNWALAQRDFGSRTGMDLLETLQSGKLSFVNSGLVKTWPAGADVNFPKRYINNLAALKAPATPPPSKTITVMLSTTAASSDGTPVMVVLKGT